MIKAQTLEQQIRGTWVPVGKNYEYFVETEPIDEDELIAKRVNDAIKNLYERIRREIKTRGHSYVHQKNFEK